MAEDEEAGAMQLNQLEQELIEKKRRLELLDQKLAEEGSDSVEEEVDSPPTIRPAQDVAKAARHEKPKRSEDREHSRHEGSKDRDRREKDRERKHHDTDDDEKGSRHEHSKRSHNKEHSRRDGSRDRDRRDKDRDRDRERGRHQDDEDKHHSRHEQSKRSHHDRDRSRHDVSKDRDRHDKDRGRDRHHGERDRTKKDRDSGHKRSGGSIAGAPAAKRGKPAPTSTRTVVIYGSSSNKKIEISSDSDGSDMQKGRSSERKVTARRKASTSSSDSSSEDEKPHSTSSRKKQSSDSSGDSSSDSSDVNSARKPVRRPSREHRHVSPRGDDKDDVPMALKPITPTRYESSDEDERPGSRYLYSPTPSPPPMRPEEPALPEYTFYHPALEGCRNVDEFEYLNRIEEGTYGVVFRGKEKKSGRIVALKKLKMEKEKEGFPITSLREVNTLLKAKHVNIVDLQEIVVGSNMDKIFLVMEYVEHDLKTLMESMKEGFLVGEVKTLVRQLLAAVHHMHDNWILHRDLKTSNLLLNHKGILKVADFGLAREYGSPPKPYTPIVVTLWYRAPELLLGGKMYTTAIDMWSVGCIFAELVMMKPLFQGRTEIDQIQQIFKLLGKPNEKIWPGWKELPAVQKVTFAEQPYNHLKEKLPNLTANGIKLLDSMLRYDPKQRATADDCSGHEFFKEGPLPVDPAMFPTWPARSELPRHKKMSRSPKAPDGGAIISDMMSKDGDGFHLTHASHGSSKKGMGFTLKF